jgi:hypothetical protein
MDLQVRVQSLARRGDDDDSLGEYLAALVTDAARRGGAPAAAIVVGSGRVDIVPLAPIAQANVPVPAFLAGLTHSPFGDEPPDAVGLIGTFRMRRKPGDPGVPVAMVFLEWTDCRWWQWRALLDVEAGRATLREDTETILRAVDGTPKPARLGGWWSLGRRRPVRLEWHRREPIVFH